MISPDEKWVSICEFDEDNEIRFTKEYLDLSSELGWGARKFAAHLITHWDLDFQTILDYFGPADAEEDKYSGIDGEPMDVKEDVTDLWEYYGKPYDGLDGEWYRDVLRSKLITLKLPERIIKEYVKIAKKATTSQH
jgi:hypothetical protein